MSDILYWILWKLVSICINWEHYMSCTVKWLFLLSKDNMRSLDIQASTMEWEILGDVCNILFVGLFRCQFLIFVSRIHYESREIHSLIQLVHIFISTDYSSLAQVSCESSFAYQTKYAYFIFIFACVPNLMLQILAVLISFEASTKIT